jgi:hypothetical protein
MEGGRWKVDCGQLEKGKTTFDSLPSEFENERGGIMKRRGKTNRLKAALKRKNVKSSLRKSKGERKYPT